MIYKRTTTKLALIGSIVIYTLGLALFFLGWWVKGDVFGLQILAFIPIIPLMFALAGWFGFYYDARSTQSQSSRIHDDQISADHNSVDIDNRSKKDNFTEHNEYMDDYFRYDK